MPGTCGSGYNSLRFDDEVTRYSLYRNFFEPYGREWQGGNSRWDLIDLVRSAYALRPEGINWPQDEGRVSLKLESLTAANGIAHTQAHDALSDVRATIALARLVRDKQPKLYDFLYRQRSKARVLEQIHLLQPLLHVSGRYSAARHYISVVLPLAWHPKNRNALIVCDLQLDPQVLLHLDAQTLRERLYTRREQLTADQLPVPLKLLHVNRCPVLAPLSVLRDSDKQRLQLDLALCQEHATVLRDSQGQWQSKLSTIYAEEDFAPQQDPEQQLYAGFLGDRDRRLCERVRKAEPEDLARPIWPFDDERLPELLFRYRARNFSQTLTVVEAERWQLFCKQRLTDAQYGAPNTLDAFTQALQQAFAVAGPDQQVLLGQWQGYAEQLARRLGC